MNVLIVDDEPANLKLLDKILRSQGYQRLVLVDDARMVIDLYRATQPALILLERNLKQTFDPQGLLNPGKIFPRPAR